MKIFGGCPSKGGAVPWMVILEDMNCATLCGGTQINLKFILTAAHCIDQFEKMPRKMCPERIVKKVLPYPNNINSKYLLVLVLMYCIFTATQSRKVHTITIETIGYISPFLYC